MKFIFNLFSTKNPTRTNGRRKTLEYLQQELLNKQGKEQFKKLLDKGLQVPVALL